MSIAHATQAPPFELTGVDGSTHRLDDYRDAPALAVEGVPLLQRAQQHQGARDPKRHAEDEAGAPAPAERQREAEAERRRDRHLPDGAGDRDRADREQILEREMQADAEHQQDHADLGELRRKRLVGGTRPAFQDEELVSGIADLQVLVGVDDLADADEAVDRWIEPGVAAGAANIRALRIEVEAQSDVPERDQPGLVRRKRVARVVELRNAGPSP